MSKAVFRPVRGTEASIANLPKVDGSIYYAEDTGRIYMDKDQKRIPMGGGNGVTILYGEFPEGVTPNEEGFYEFSINNSS
jgi:hypothetical protein